MIIPDISRFGFGSAIMNLTIDNGDIKTLYGHEGQIFGFRSLIQIIKEDNNSVILVDNNQNTELGKIAKEIRNILYSYN